MPVEKQVAIIYCGTKGLMRSVPVNKVRDFEESFLSVMEANHKDVLEQLRAGKLTDEITGTLEKVAAEVATQYN